MVLVALVVVTHAMFKNIVYEAFRCSYLNEGSADEHEHR